MKSILSKYWLYLRHFYAKIVASFSKLKTHIFSCNGCKYLFGIFFLFILQNKFCYADPTTKLPKIISPSFVPFADRNLFPTHKELKNSTYDTVRFVYFLQEITNFIDKKQSIYFYDYINPDVPQQAFISNSFNIYKKILLLKDIEKSPKERAAIQDISRFLATNYKTQVLPSYIYANNPHLPQPFYLSQLAHDAFQAIKNGNIDALHALVNNYKILSVKNKLGNGLLATAILNNRNNMVKFLISKGANVNATNKQGATPIIIAAKMKNFEAANFLVKKGCNLRKLDNSGNSALYYASKNENTAIYYLIENNLKIKSSTIKSKNKYTSFR